MTCKHRWRLFATTGPTTVRGMIAIDRCQRCSEERQRKATREEVAERKAEERESTKLHKLGWELDRKLKGRVGYDAMLAWERFVKAHPNETMTTGVDDGTFSSSELGFLALATEKRMFCFSGIYFPQNSSGGADGNAETVSPRYFHLYAGHLEGLYEAVKKMRRFAMRFPEWRRDAAARRKWLRKNGRKPADDRGGGGVLVLPRLPDEEAQVRVGDRARPRPQP
jgi:hypothetical protein